MTRTRFTQWVVLACIGTLAACTSGDGGPGGNTQLNIIIPNGSDNGSSAPGALDVTSVEYSINCEGGEQGGGFLDGSTFDDSLPVQGNIEVEDGSNPPIAQGFMDIPPGDCLVQLRARDDDGEVICTGDNFLDTAENQNVDAGEFQVVTIVLVCDVSFQAPVGNLDVRGDFDYTVGNFCPDLIVLNCVDSALFPTPEGCELNTPPNCVDAGPDVAGQTSCEVRYRDGDGGCGDGCDPQDCSDDGSGFLTCTRPDPPVDQNDVALTSDGSGGYLSRTTITCDGGVLDCDNDGTFGDTSCTFDGDQLGTLPTNAPIIPNPAGFGIQCNESGVDVTCTALTTDGDRDCNKTKVVTVECPGASPCDDFGGDAACQAAAGTVCVDSVCVDAGVSGTPCDGTAANCCQNTPVADSPPVSCDGEEPAPAVCIGGVCNSQNCNAPGAAPCDDGNECTTDSCPPTGTACEFVLNDGASCAGDTGVCQDVGGAAECVDNCSGVTCDDGNPCTDDPACDPSGGTATCPTPVNDDANACSQGDGSAAWDNCTQGSACVCEAGSCENAPASLAAATGSQDASFSCTISGNVTVNLTVDATLSVDSSGVGNAVDLSFDVVAFEPGVPLLAGVAGATSIQVNIPGFSPSDTAAVSAVTNGEAQGPAGPGEVANPLDPQVPLLNLFNFLSPRQPICAGFPPPAFCPFNDIILRTPPAAAITSACNGLFSSQCYDPVASTDNSPVFQSPAKNCDIFQGSGTGLPLACDAGFACASGYCNSDAVTPLQGQICELDSECASTCDTVAGTCTIDPSTACTTDADCTGTCTSFPPDAADPAIPRTNCAAGAAIPFAWQLASDTIVPDALTPVQVAQDRIDLNIAALFGVLPIFVSTGDTSICTVNSSDPAIEIPVVGP